MVTWPLTHTVVRRLNTAVDGIAGAPHPLHVREMYMRGTRVSLGYVAQAIISPPTYTFRDVRALAAGVAALVRALAAAKAVGVVI